MPSHFLVRLDEDNTLILYRLKGDGLDFRGSPSSLKESKSIKTFHHSSLPYAFAVNI